MANELAEYEQTELIEAEKKVHEAEQAFCESFYLVGVALKKIYDNELWRAAGDGIDSWNKYCTSGRLDISRRYADQLIAASQVRSQLAVLPNVGPLAPVWTEKTVRELTRLPKPSDVKRASKKVVTQVKRGKPLTARLVKEIVDVELGTPEKKQKAKAKRLAAATTPSEGPETAWMCLLGTVHRLGRRPDGPRQFGDHEALQGKRRSLSPIGRCTEAAV